MSAPASYLNWIPSGSASYITQPSSGQQTTGWTPAEAPPSQVMNWLFYTIDQWIQYLAGVALVAPTAATVSAANVAASTTGTYTIGGLTIVVASATGIYPGQVVAATAGGIAAGTLVQKVSGTTVTLTTATTSNQTATPVTFSHQVATGTSVQAQLDRLDSKDFLNVFPINPALSNIVALSSTDPVLGDAGKIFNVNTLNGNVEFDLPSPIAGFKFTIKDIAGYAAINNIAVNPFSSETIEGLAAGYACKSPYGTWTFICDGINWWLV